jgi:hypothetical protein
MHMHELSTPPWRHCVKLRLLIAQHPYWRPVGRLGFGYGGSAGSQNRHLHGDPAYPSEAALFGLLGHRSGPGAVAPDREELCRRLVTRAQCYGFRCDMLHQGASGKPHRRGASGKPHRNYDRIVFVLPAAINSTMHLCISRRILLMDLEMFCRDITGAVRAWLATVQGTQPFEAHGTGSCGSTRRALRQILSGFR